MGRNKPTSPQQGMGRDPRACSGHGVKACPTSLALLHPQPLSPVLSKFGWFWFVYKCLLNFRYCGGDLILYWKSNANSSTNEGVSPASSSRRRLYIPSRTTNTADSSDVQVAKRDTCDAFLAPVCCACHTVRRCLAVCGLGLGVVRFHCCYRVQLHCCCFVCLVADSVSCSWH
jgi:hypothetical protein